MKNHYLRKGVILIEICGVYLLIADQEARKHCPYIKQINETGAFIWRQIESDNSLDGIISGLQKEYELPDSTDIRSEVNAFIQSLNEVGYIV